MLFAITYSLRKRFCRQHSALHGCVRAFDAGYVYKACCTANQGAAGEGQFRHRLPAALVNRARAVSHALAAFQIFADRRVRLPTLEFFKRRHVWVFVIKRGDETDGDLPICLMIEEAPTPAIAFRQGPALRVDDAAGNVLVRRNVPNLFDTEAVNLRLTVRLKVVFRLHFLGQ